jgi:hypothetical protein
MAVSLKTNSKPPAVKNQSEANPLKEAIFNLKGAIGDPTGMRMGGSRDFQKHPGQFAEATQGRQGP